MGLKSGSRDAGLDDEETTEVESEADSRTDGDTPPSGEGATTDVPDDTAAPATDAGGDDSSDHPSMDSIPYKLRREKVNEGRQQVPYFLRDEVIAAEDDLQDSLESILGEDVYKSDYREAAMVVAQRNPELVADVLREWGYDLS